jgi:hypothetical protein
MKKKYMVYAYPRRGALWVGPQQAGPFTRPEALVVAKEQRGRRCFSRVRVQPETPIRLSAAAPRLLRALENLVYHDGRLWETPVPEKLRREIRAAIAEALGK